MNFSQNFALKGTHYNQNKKNLQHVKKDSNEFSANRGYRLAKPSLSKKIRLNLIENNANRFVLGRKSGLKQYLVDLAIQLIRILRKI